MTHREETLAQFCELMGLDDKSHICPIARRILEEHVCDEAKPAEWLEKARAVVRAEVPDAEVVENFCHRARPEHIAQIFFLAAMGAQRAAETTDNRGVDIREFFVDEQERRPFVSFAYCAPDSQLHPNSMFVTLMYMVSFCGRAFGAEPADASQQSQDRYRAVVHQCIKAGAEEAYHAFQHNDPEQQVALELNMRARYGDDWSSERLRQLNAAATAGKEAVKEFERHDPAEQDAQGFRQTLQFQMDALTERFLTAQKGPRR